MTLMSVLERWTESKWQWMQGCGKWNGHCLYHFNTFISAASHVEGKFFSWQKFRSNIRVICTANFSTLPCILHVWEHIRSCCVPDQRPFNSGQAWAVTGRGGGDTWTFPLPEFSSWLPPQYSWWFGLFIKSWLTLPMWILHWIQRGISPTTKVWHFGVLKIILPHFSRKGP